MPVVVLRNVQAAGGRNVSGRVIQQRCSRDAALGNRLGIQEGFEGGARLAQRQHAINLGRVAKRARRADPGQHLAAGVVEHHHRTVFHMTALQFAQVLGQGLDGKALQRGAQGGLEGGVVVIRGGRAQRHQPPRQMRCNPFAGIEGLALQRASRKEVKSVAICLHARCLHRFEDAAGALRDLRGPGVRRPHQRRGQRGLAFLQPVRGLAEQCAAQGINAHHLATKRHQVEVSLQDLVLAPVLFQHLR